MGEITNLKLHIDKVSIGGKIIYQDEKITIVPGLIMMEGVQNRGLKRFEQFYDPDGLEGAMWFLGTPITREHPQDHPAGIATHVTTKLGRISKVEPDPGSRKVPAEFTFFNKRLTPEEMEKINKGERIGDSIGYFCNEKPLEEPKIWETTGEEYDHEEIGPFFGDHVALTNNPACAECGVNANSSYHLSNCQCPNKSKKESETIPDEGKQGEQKPPGEQNAQTDGQEGKPPEGKQERKNPGEKTQANDQQEGEQLEGKPPEKAEDKVQKNAIDLGELQIRAKTILQIQDEYTRAKEAMNLLMELVSEGTAQGNAKIAEEKMDSRILEKLTSLETKINSQATELKDLREKEAARQNAAKAQQEEQAKTNARAVLLPAHQGAEFDEKYYPEIKAIGLNAWMLGNREKVDWDALKGGKTPVPAGQQFVTHGDDQTVPGITSVADLTKKFYPGSAEEGQKKGGQ